MIAGPGVLPAKRFLTRARLLIASSRQRHLRARSCREIHLGWIHNAVFNRGLTAGVQNEEKVEPQHFFYKVHSSTEEMGSMQERVLPRNPHPRVDHGLGGWRNEQDQY